MSSSQKPQMSQAELLKIYQDLLDKVTYSARYEDESYEYRHVILPKQMLKFMPEQLYSREKRAFKIMTESEWRSIGIQQSLGWEHYEIHAPEPHVLLFRRELDFATRYPRGRPEFRMVHSDEEEE
ncbi:cyclin-dependent protein kinase regulatory subunit Suc1 [Atractiella rhizophila]|nr:cyclin-dependent protein kinase regulatory subunit Suc1 [Atractiella rhizophila]